MQLLARLFPWFACLCAGLFILYQQSQLTAERDFRSSVQAQLHAPNNHHDTLSAFLTGALETSSNRKATLDQIDRDAAAAKQRSDQHDAALSETQKQNLEKLAAIQGTLTDLKARKSAGNLVDDCVVMTEDSKLPWKGWHK